MKKLSTGILIDMAMLDIDNLVAELDLENPCGINLEYSSAFLEIEEEIRGKPEVQYGGLITPAVSPDWKKVRQLSFELFERSRDLRVAVFLVRALLNLQGLSGLEAGLAVIAGLIESRWEAVHPQLDPDDGNDPTLRVNTLSAICEISFLKDVREAVLVSSRVQGQFSLREFDIATGELAVSDSESNPTLADIEAGFVDIDSGEIEQTLTSLSNSCQLVERIERSLTEKVGVGKALDLSALVKMLERARSFVQERYARRTHINGLVSSSSGGMKEGLSASAGNVVCSNEILNMEDATGALDRICTYYARHEPSSPVPLLLRRAQKLMGKNFIEILEDIAPEGLGQVRQISGVKQEV